MAACGADDAPLERSEAAGVPSTPDIGAGSAVPSTVGTTAPVASVPDAGAPATTSPATTTVPNPTAPPPVAPIRWSSCSGGECATVSVPVDHADPAGPTIDVGVFRRPATGTRIGALFVNFGGPGQPTHALARSFDFPGDITAAFDIVAADPRGIGASTPLGCGVDPVELYRVDPTIEDDADRAALLDVSRRFAADCERRRGSLLPHVGSRTVARDLDLVRAAMGDDRLNFLGYSYGTAIGQAYADLFPDRVRAMVFDGVVDPAGTGVETATAQARGFETALARWAAGCGERRSCRFADPIGAVDDMLAAAEDGVTSRAGARSLGPGEAAIGLALPLYAESLWPTLDQAVAAALDGDGTAMVDLADRYTRLIDFSAYFAVSCLDAGWPDDPDTHLAAAADAARVSPRFGEAIVNDYVRCAVWPADEQPLGAITAAAAPPILLVSTTGDPATPHDGALRVAERLASGVLLTHEGDGHLIVFRGNPCVDRVALDYLLDLVPPPDGDRC